MSINFDTKVPTKWGDFTIKSTAFAQRVVHAPQGYELPRELKDCFVTLSDAIQAVLEFDRSGKRLYQMNASPDFEKIGGQNILLCNKCKEPFTHFLSMEIYDKKYDDESEKALHIAVKSQTRSYTTSLNDEGNPSRRRNGVKLMIQCELCGYESYLNMHQHKGATIIEWERI